MHAVTSEGSPYGTEGPAFRGRGNQVNGKSPFGVVTNHEMLRELTPLDPPGLLGAKCQLSGPIIGKNQMSQMEDNVVFNRNKQKKVFFLF